MHISVSEAVERDEEEKCFQRRRCENESAPFLPFLSFFLFLTERDKYGEGECGEINTAKEGRPREQAGSHKK